MFYGNKNYNFETLYISIKILKEINKIYINK